MPGVFLSLSSSSIGQMGNVMQQLTMQQLDHRFSNRNHRRSAGFTIMELMITVAIAAILITIAVPNFKLQIEQGRFTSAANEIVTALNYARGEAIRRSRPVSVARAGATWDLGWNAFVDPARTGVLGAQTPLRQGNPLGSISVSGAPTFVLFDSSGRRRSDTASAFISFDVFKTGADPSSKRTVCVAQSGRIFTVKGAASCV